MNRSELGSTWLDARPHLKPLAAKLQGLLELADGMWRRGRASGESVDYDKFEQTVAEQTAEVERALHQATLSSLDIDAPFVRMWGKTYRRLHRTSRNYCTLAGSVPVTRTLYREVGTRSGAALDPIAQRAGVVDGSWLPRTARAMAHLLAQGTSREAETTSVELLRLPYSRSSFERVGHTVGAEYMRRRQVLEPKFIAVLELPADVRSVSVSVDRVAVPMEEPLAREANTETQAQALQRERLLRPGVELSPADAALREILLNAETHPQRRVSRNYRMAYCATLTLHDGAGEALHTIRYGRMPPTPETLAAYTHRDAHALMQRLRDDVVSLRERRPDLTVVLIADGAPELWNLFSAHLDARSLGVQPIELVDAWHALEYVAAAARFLEFRGKCPPGTFRRWRECLLERQDGVLEVIKALSSAGLIEARDATGKRPVGDAIRYLENRVPRMDYAGARARGLVIGSGAVEATCKCLVALRMKRAGARWKPQTGNEVLALRALQLSDRWQLAVSSALKPLAKSVQVVPRVTALQAA